MHGLAERSPASEFRGRAEGLREIQGEFGAFTGWQQGHPGELLGEHVDQLVRRQVFERGANRARRRRGTFRSADGPVLAGEDERRTVPTADPHIALID